MMVLFDSAALSAVNGGLWSSFNGSFATTKIPNSVPSENVFIYLRSSPFCYQYQTIDNLIFLPASKPVLPKVSFQTDYKCTLKFSKPSQSLNPKTITLTIN